MFAEVVQNKKSTAESVRDTAGEIRRIFRKWRARGRSSLSRVSAPASSMKPAGAEDRA
jgi:hypothetical protein